MQRLPKYERIPIRLENWFWLDGLYGHNVFFKRSTPIPQSKLYFIEREVFVLFPNIIYQTCVKVESNSAAPWVENPYRLLSTRLQ